MTALSAALLAALAAVPLADLAPYAVKRQPDGTLEYAYDLTAIKALAATPDAVQAWGEDEVRAFLQSLPRGMTLAVAPGAPLEVSSGRALESGRLATSFATIPEGPMASDNPLADRERARLRAPLDPGEPRLLLSAEAIAWQVRELELSAVAAVEADTEALRRELWSRVLERALQRAKAGQGDVREGALALSARLAAAGACLDQAKVPAALRADAELSQAIDAELSRLTQSPDALVAPAPWSWRPELTCAWVRLRAMGQPFERSRAGTVAVLLFLDLLAKDPKLSASWDRVRSRRDRFLGAPAAEPLLAWRDKAQGRFGEAIDALNDFIESLPHDARVPPPLVALPQTPFGAFLAELRGVERGQAFAELASAVQDGRVSAGATTWPHARDAALGALCLPDAHTLVSYDGAWRDRLQGAFTALLGGSTEARGDGPAPEREQGERSELKVRLLVPPLLEVEPVPVLFARSATSLERLVEALAAEQASGLALLGADGARGGPISATAKAWIPRLRGLAVLASPDGKDSKELAEARRLAASWRSEPAFSREVREASAAPVSASTERLHAAIVGVSRRELVVTYGRPPRVSAAGGASLQPFVVAPSEQRYIVPVLVTVAAPAEPGRRPLERGALKALVDAAGREAAQAEGAFAEALHR